MPYNSSTSAYERRAATVIDATPDGDTVAVAIDVKLDQGIDDYVTDLNHHNANGNHYPATSVGSDSRFLKQSPAGVVSWADGVVAADAALKDFSNVANGAISNEKLAAIAPTKITQNASNRFVTDAEKSTWNGALYDKADVEGVLTGTITTHTHAAATSTAKGIVELATTAEAAAGADTSMAVTAAGVDAYHKANNIVLSASAPASGLWVEFSPIPEGVKRITVMFDGVSTNGVSPIIIRIGAGSIQTTGYSSSGVNMNAGGSIGILNSNSGFALLNNTNSSLYYNVTACLHKMSGYIYTMDSAGAGSSTSAIAGSGKCSLTSVLDRIRITTVNGTDTFDAGTINISWEF